MDQPYWLSACCTSVRRQSMWMCSWFCDRATAGLTARLIQSRGRLPPAAASVKTRARQASAVLDARLGEGEKREKDLAARLAAVEAQAKATAEQLAQAQAQAAGLQAAAARVEQMEHELAESRVQQRELLAMLTKPQQIKN